GHNNFYIWKIQMMALLRREGSIHAIDDKYPDNKSDFDKEKIEGDALSVIQLSLAPNVLCDMSTSSLLQDHLDVFNKLVMDLQTVGIKKDEETLACALLFSLTSKYRDIENSMMYSKDPITLNSCDVRMHFEGDKCDEASGLFVRGRTSQQGRSKSKYK
ncbi:hypothetical protein H5410_057846, partial [Solanum commersonii]